MYNYDNAVLITEIVCSLVVGIALIFLLVCLFQNKSVGKRLSHRYGGKYIMSWKAPYIAGLSFPEGVKAYVCLLSNGFAFSALNQDVFLPEEKISSVSITKLSKLYAVSNAGGAIAGGMALGPIGALIGGAPQLSMLETNSPLLIISYNSDDETKYIIFDAQNNNIRTIARKAKSTLLRSKINSGYSSSVL